MTNEERENLLVWLRKQESGGAPAGLLLPVTNNGKPNNPKLFYPSPEKLAKKWNFINPSIWDEIVKTNDRERYGVQLTTNGSHIEDLALFEIESFSGFTVVLAGGDEIAVHNLIQDKSHTKSSRMLIQALRPYRGHPEFFETIEGPLLVTLYWLRSKGITVTEVRLIPK